MRDVHHGGPDVGWHSGNSGATPHAVAAKDPNACGLFDMSGNVWEWAEDWYSSTYYTSSGRTDPTGPSTGSLRVGSGGGWGNHESYARVASRTIFDPSNVSQYDLGFRLARIVDN